MSTRPLALDDSAALRLVVEGTVAETGTAFFRALVRNLAEVMGTTGAWVTEYMPVERKLRSHAFWLHGNYLDGYEHAIDGTPCAEVVDGRRLVHYPDRILEIYADDADLRQAQAVSYMGVPLLDLDQSVMGHLAVLDTKPLPSEPRLLSLFEIFAARAAAEARRLRAEQAVRAREEQVSALLTSAMDAIVVMDGAEKICRANPAAERLLGCSAEDLLGEDARDFLTKESVARLEAFMRELRGRPAGERQLWIPQSFTALRWDRSTFPAEATLSAFESGGQIYHTLILRNVDEREAAERRIALLTSQAEFLRESAREAGLGEMLGRSAPMRELFTALKRVAGTEATVLVMGETGTGKELIACSLHAESQRAKKPFVRVNCAAIPGTLIESEFFGHEKGAFTGAVTRREGRFALADGGTIFLDEVGELPLDLQAKLLRVLQEGEFEPLGSAQTRKVDVRVIAATNRDLGAMVRDGKFREDLYYRLNVFPLRVPPLRERGADVEVLAAAFVGRLARRMGRCMEPLSAADLARLREYAWPGNVRELQNVIERAIILSPGPRLELHRAMPETAQPIPAEAAAQCQERIFTAREMERLETENIGRALAACGGKVSGAGGAAALLGMPASTLSSRMKSLGIARKS